MKKQKSESGGLQVLVPPQSPQTRKSGNPKRGRRRGCYRLEDHGDRMKEEDLQEGEDEEMFDDFIYNVFSFLP